MPTKHYIRKYTGKGKEVPVGEIKYTLPDQPATHYFLNTRKQKQNQMWERPHFPKDIMRWGENDPRLIEIENREWMRREHGVWFFVDGEPTYITGLHYYYLTHWKIDAGWPQYRDSDRLWYYFWDAVVRNPDCKGMLYMKPRRDGLTFRAGNMLYEFASKVKESYCGIQSKTETDGKSVFRKFVVRPWQKLILPSFKPVYEGSTNPVKQLSMRRAAKRVSASSDYSELNMEDDDSLNSLIDYKDSSEIAYDGAALHRVFIDEFGKMENVDIQERNNVLSYCISRGAKIVGKILMGSTIEEMRGKSLEQSMQIWEDSDPNKLDANGQTVSGLWRYFKPADFCLEKFIDKYGRSVQYDPEEPVEGIDGQMIHIGARTYILNRRAALKKTGNHAKLASELRKMPLTIHDSFVRTAQDACFNVIKLNERLMELRDMKAQGESPTVRGDLVWEDGINSSVKFIPNDVNGRFLIAQQPTVPNNVAKSRFGDFFKPGNNHTYFFGIDPYDFSDVVREDLASKGAGAVFRRPNIIDPEDGNRFVCVYCYRPSTNVEFYYDMMKMAWYYGCAGVIEKNKDLCRTHFVNNNMTEFVLGKLRTDKTKPQIRNPRASGEYTLKPQLLLITDVLEEYIEHNAHKLDFEILISQLIPWNIENSNELDLVIAGGYALMASMFEKQANPDTEKGKVKPLAGFAKKYRPRLSRYG